MIDASIAFPFFARNFNGETIGMDSNVTWHNENNGVMMINQYFKADKDYENKIRKLGKQVVEIDEKLEIEAFDYIDSSNY